MSSSEVVMVGSIKSKEAISWGLQVLRSGKNRSLRLNCNSLGRRPGGIDRTHCSTNWPDPGAEKEAKGEYYLALKQLTCPKRFNRRLKYTGIFMTDSYYSALYLTHFKVSIWYNKINDQFYDLSCHDGYFTFLPGETGESHVIFQLHAKFVVWSAKFTQLCTILYSSVDFKVLENVYHMLLSISSHSAWC